MMDGLGALILGGLLDRKGLAKRSPGRLQALRVKFESCLPPKRHRWCVNFSDTTRSSDLLELPRLSNLKNVR